MKEHFTKNGVDRYVREGFAWSIACFGFMALLIRGQYRLCIINFFTFGFAKYYYMFTANRLLKEKYLLDGWKLEAEKIELISIEKSKEILMMLLILIQNILFFITTYNVFNFFINFLNFNQDTKRFLDYL